MNDDKDNYSTDEFDIDKILAEVRAMKAADPQGNDSPAGEPYSADDETGEQPEIAGESLEGVGTNGMPETNLPDEESEMLPDTQEEPDAEDAEQPAAAPLLALFEAEEPESAAESVDETGNEPVIKPDPFFSGSPDLPWWESPEAEEIFGPRKTVDPPEEVIIEPVETQDTTDTQAVPAQPADVFFTAPGAPEPPAPVVPAVSNGMETDEARERFFNDLVLEKTAEHDVPGPNDPIEKPGVVVEKGVSARTSDLEPMPTVLPAEEVLRAAQLAEEKTRLSGAAAPPGDTPADKKDVLDGQIILRGFETKEPQAETVSELNVEEALIAKRREKAKKFIKIVGIPDEEDENAPADIFKGYDEPDTKEDAPGEEAAGKQETAPLEYRFPEQRNRIYNAIGTAAKRASTSTVFLAVIEMICLLLLFLPKLLASAAVDSPSLAADGSATIIINLFLLFSAAFVGLSGIISGFKSLIRLKPNCDAGVSLAVAACAAHLVFALFLNAPEGYAVSAFSAAAVFALLLNNAAKKTAHTCTLDNFRFCAFDQSQALHSVSAVDDANEAFELGRGILMGNPAVVYSSKINFPASFIANAKEVGLAEKFCRIIVPASAGAAVLTGFIAGLVAKNFLFGFSLFTASMCLGVPAASLLASVMPLRFANKHLNDSGGMIVSQGAAQDLSASNAVVIDSSELFDRARCGMHGMKDFKNVRIDDVLLYAAALVIKSGGPLTDVFDKVIAGHRELLPPVKSFSYEDRQGISALIHTHKILLGNRTLMVNHSIDVPSKSDEDKYKHDGRRILYLAIANKIAAIFVVGYTADETLLPYLKTLENNGVQLLVRTCDANITEDLLSDCFGLPVTNVKVVSATAGRLFKRIREQVKETAPARVLHDGSTLSLVKSIAAAFGITYGIKAGQIVQAAGVGLGLLGLIILTAASAAGAAGALQIVVYQAFWAAAAVGAGFLRRVR